MSSESPAPTKKPFRKWTVILLAAVVVFGVTFIVYFRTAFPEVRCEAAKHLESPEKVSDCYGCHLKATPKVAQDWYESKHGLILVKCFVCHGEPDGKGSVPYAVNPDVDATCRKCHDTSILEMERKYGLELKCAQCHPFHQNSLHHKAYEKPVAKKTLD